mgnify:CR=1 FL=1
MELERLDVKEMRLLVTNSCRIVLKIGVLRFESKA